MWVQFSALLFPACLILAKGQTLPSFIGKKVKIQTVRPRLQGELNETSPGTPGFGSVT